MTFRIASRIHNLECMLTTLVSPMRAMMLKKQSFVLTQIQIEFVYVTLNTTKTEFLLIGSSQRLSTLERNPIIEINQFPIKQVSTSKSLGVHIDGNLSWECHINEISKKIASGISAIKRIRYFLPFEILLNVYNSLVQPHFDYCNVVWRNCSKNLSSKLQKLQNRVASKAIMMHSIINN